MAGILSADEVFQIAMELEETGQVFYEAMAAASPSEQVARLCRRLAEQEVEHYRTFEEMRGSLASRPEGSHLTWEDLNFAQALVNERIIPDPQSARRIAAEASLAKTLEMAIQMEKDSVAFYTGLLAGLDGDDAEAVGRIIKEEESHAKELMVARRNL